MFCNNDTSGLYYKHVTIINDDSSIISKRSVKLIGNSRVIIYDCNRFILQVTGVNVIKLFSLLQRTRPNKLECLYLAITFQSSLTLAGNIRSLPNKEASERPSNSVGSGLALKF